MSTLLRKLIPVLEGLSGGSASVSEITGADLFYTDGAADEAEYKIYLYKTKEYHHTIYIKKDGTWFCINETDMLKKWMSLWLESITTEYLK